MATLHSHRRILSAWLACLACSLLAAAANAQVNYFFQPAPTDPEASRFWQDDSNWLDPNLQNSFVPNYLFNERALIENGATAVLTVSSPSTGVSSVVTPGALAINNGGVDIRSGGSLFVTSGEGSPGTVSVGGSGPGSLLVNSGATLTADGNLSVVGDAANELTVGGPAGAAATVTANAAVLGGTTTLYPNASFSTTAGVNLLGTSVYNAAVTGVGANGKINAGAAANLSGTLHLDFSGFTPSGGDSWTVVEASSISGGFESVTSNAELAFNQTLVVSQADLGGGRTGLNATINEVLVLDINRDTGSATLTHPGASTIEFDGYYIGSDIGSLRDDDASWNSLNEGGQLGADWVETAQTVNNIGELKIGANATFGSDIDLGPIYDALAGDFGQSGEDLVFRYRRASDGLEFPGIVRYSGTKANTLVLQVDPSGTGDAFLRNTSDTTVQIDAYEVLSDAGSLDPSGWNSLDDQDGSGNAWLEADSPSAGLLAEFDSEGFTTLAPGASLNLGSLFTGGDQDLEFNFLMMGETESSSGLVVYQELAAILGDFNQDGSVDAADYVVYRNNLGAAGLPNDNGLGTVGPAHLQLWKDNYGQSSSSATAASVPEPTAGVLVLASVVAGATVRTRRRS